MIKESQRFKSRIDPRFSPYLLLVGRSRIDRYGVFAGQTIPRNRKVIEYTGEHISYLAATRRFRKLLRSGRPRRLYLFVLDRRRIIDGAVGGSGAELINHSCNPNLVRRRSSGHIYYHTRRRIRIGEELSVDYHYSPDTMIFKCRCGSPHCRGTINLKPKTTKGRPGVPMPVSPGGSRSVRGSGHRDRGS